MFCSIDHYDRMYGNNWDAHHAPHYTFKLFTEICIFSITLTCWQFVEICHWCNHFLSALPLVCLRKLVSVCCCWHAYFGMIWESFGIKAQLKCHLLWGVLKSCSWYAQTGPGTHHWAPMHFLTSLSIRALVTLYYYSSFMKFSSFLEGRFL